MRIHFRSICVLGLLVLGAAYGPGIVSVRGTTGGGGAPLPQALLSHATSDPAFVLPIDRWLDFDLPDGISATRLLSNASLTDAVRFLSDEEVLTKEWSYRIQYELRGRGADLIDSGVYHFRTKLDRYRDPQSGDAWSARFYDSQKSGIAVTQEMVLDRQSFDREPQWLRLRLESADPGIEEVVVRANGRLERADSQLTHAWRRLSPDRRTQLSSSSVYPQEMLTRRQQLNLLRTVWSPFAPVGHAGRNYEQRTLFTARDMEPFRVREIPEPAGFCIHRTLNGMLPVPAEPGRLQLEFTTLPMDGAVIATRQCRSWPETVDLLWYGHRFHERSTVKIRFAPPGGFGDETPLNFHEAAGSTIAAIPIAGTGPGGVGPDGSRRWKCELPITDGLCELRSAVPLIVRAFWQPLAPSAWQPPASSERQPPASSVADGVPLEVTPQPAYVRTYATTADQPVEFAVSHLAGQMTTVRVSVRAVAGRSRPAPHRSGLEEDQQKVDLNELFLARTGEIPSIVYATIGWRFLDAGGNVVRRGVVTGESAWSVHDRLATDVMTTQVSDPLDYFFNVPDSVTRLQLVTTGAPLLLSMATRPPDVAKVTAIPEDYSAYTRHETDNRSWFAVRPTQHAWFVETGRSPLLIAQPRPPVDDPDLAAGRYLWEDFPPRGDWRARHVLTPRDPAQPMTEESVPLPFHELPCNTDTPLRLLADAGRRTVAPALVFRFGDSPPSPINISIGGRLHHRVIPQSDAGEVVLPPWIVDRDVENVRVDCDVPVQLWMNRVALEEAGSPLWVQRLAVEFDQTTCEFPYKKLSAGPERLSVLLFRPLDDPNRTALRVTIVPQFESGDAAPGTQFTLRERVFSFAPPEGPPTLMLPTPGGSPCDAGRACLIPLGDDLPAGEYLIRITREPTTPHAATKAAHAAMAAPHAAKDRMFLIVSRTTPGEFDLRELSIEILPEAVP
jgi:hypothetical protein